jgi:Short C-terminal domain
LPLAFTEETTMPLRRRPVARLATTAVVAGTAAHMGAASAQRNAAAQAPPAPAEAEAPVALAAPESAADAQIEEITKLGALKDQGLLTEEEFTAKKAQILGI